MATKDGASAEFVPLVNEEDVEKGLQVLMDKHKLDKIDLVEESCEDSLLFALAHKVEKIEEVIPYIGMKQELVDSVMKTEENEQMVVFKVFWDWREKKELDANCLTLSMAFLRMNDTATANTVVEHARDNIRRRNRPVIPIQLFPERAPSRYPTWDSMAEDKRDSVRGKLLVQNQDVRVAYSMVVSRSLRSFDAQGVDPILAGKVIEDYGRPRDESLFLQSKEKIVFYPQFETADKIIKIFDVIVRHSSWYNFHLLEALIHRFGTEEDEERLSKYINGPLLEYTSRTLFEITGTYGDPYAACAGYEQFHLRLPDEVEWTGLDLRLILKKLPILLGMRGTPFNVRHHILPGVVHLVFTLPEKLFQCYPRDSDFFKYISWDEEKSAYIIMDDISLLLFPEVELRQEATLLYKVLWNHARQRRLLEEERDRILAEKKNTESILQDQIDRLIQQVMRKDADMHETSMMIYEQQPLEELDTS